MGALYTQVCDGTILYVVEEVLLLHVQIGERMSVALEVAPEGVLLVLADAGQRPVVEVEVLRQVHLIAVAKVGIIEVHGTFDIVLDNISLLG